MTIEFLTFFHKTPENPWDSRNKSTTWSPTSDPRVTGQVPFFPYDQHLEMVEIACLFNKAFLWIISLTGVVVVDGSWLASPSHSMSSNMNPTRYWQNLCCGVVLIVNRPLGDIMDDVMYCLSQESERCCAILLCLVVVYPAHAFRVLPSW
jgi:hypothetical protein